MDDEFLADITATGEVLSSWAGTVKATANYKGKTATATITITSAELVSLQVTPLTRSMPGGTTYQFSAIGVFTDNTTQDLTTQVAWTSDPDTVVTVTPSGGLATAYNVSPNTAEITATHAASGIYASANVTTTGATLVAVTISPLDKEIITDTQIQYKATGYYSDNTTLDITELAAWTPTGGTFAKVSDTAGTKGLATGVSAGTQTITATYSGQSASTSLTVTEATLVSIAVTPDNPIAYGTNQQFTATGTFDNGSTQDLTKQVIWSSSDEGVATIDDAGETPGLARSTGPGTTVITAEINIDGTDYDDSTNLEVRMITLQSITVIPNPSSKDIGATQQFFANGTYSDGTVMDLSNQVLWSSSNDSLAEISNAAGTQGLATAKATGSVTISAVRDRVTGTATFNINEADTKAPILSKLTMLPGNKYVQVEFDEDMSAAGATTLANYLIADSTTLGTENGECIDFADSGQTADFALVSIKMISPKVFILEIPESSTQQKTYTVIVNNKTDTTVTDLAGNKMGCPNDLTFQGVDTVKPYIVSVISDTPTSIIVRYSEDMKEGSGTTSAFDIANYVVTEDPANGTYDDPVLHATTPIAKIDARTVKINFAATLYSIPYRVTTAATVTDLSGNVMTSPRSLSFLGNEQLKMISAEAATLTTVKATFSKAVDETSAACNDISACSARYKILPWNTGLNKSVLGDITKAEVSGNTVTLTHQLDQEGIAYTVIAANAQTGDGFDNATAEKIVSAADTNERLQNAPKDRAPFIGLGTVVDSIDDGTYFEDPFGDETSFSYAFTYGGRIYLGPNDLNTNAFRFDPNGYNAALVGFEFSPYLNNPGLYPPTCSTAIGFGTSAQSCAGGTLGYYGERGLVGFNSMTFIQDTVSYEILVIGPLMNAVPYAYYTQSLDVTLPLTAIKLNYNGGNNIESVQTVYGFTHSGTHYVYTGITGINTPPRQTPQINYFTTTISGGVVTPAILAGLINLRTTAYLGPDGTPSNPANYIGIEAFLYYNNYLYVVNNGGILATQSPTDLTPSITYNPFPSGTTLHLATLGKVRPGQKGHPFMTVHNDKVYLVRNVGTTTTPTRGELWVCDPASTTVPVGNDGDGVCENGEWLKIVGGTETGIHTDSKGISMLAFNGDYCYLGFDNANSGQGVQIFCIKHAGGDLPTTFKVYVYDPDTPPAADEWVQQGVNGLGGNFSYIYSHATISDGLYNYIYITAGKTGEAIRVFRSRD